MIMINSEAPSLTCCTLADVTLTALRCVQPRVVTKLDPIGFSDIRVMCFVVTLTFNHEIASIAVLMPLAFQA